jgi:hypothetical protein
VLGRPAYSLKPFIPYSLEGGRQYSYRYFKFYKHTRCALCADRINENFSIIYAVLVSHTPLVGRAGYLAQPSPAPKLDGSARCAEGRWAQPYIRALYIICGEKEIRTLTFVLQTRMTNHYPISPFIFKPSNWAYF